MTPEQKVRVLVELVEAAKIARDMAERHSLEVIRYKVQSKNLAIAIDNIVNADERKVLTKKK